MALYCQKVGAHAVQSSNVALAGVIGTSAPTGRRGEAETQQGMSDAQHGGQAYAKAVGWHSEHAPKVLRSHMYLALTRLGANQAQAVACCSKGRHAQAERVCCPTGALSTGELCLCLPETVVHGYSPLESSPVARHGLLSAVVEGAGAHLHHDICSDLGLALHARPMLRRQVSLLLLILHAWGTMASPLPHAHGVYRQS